MWRSLARSSLLARNLLATQNSKVSSCQILALVEFPRISVYQNFRLFSDHSAIPSDVELEVSEISSERFGENVDRVSVNFGENGDVGVHEFDVGDEVREVLEDSSVAFIENGDDEMEDVGPEEEEVVQEIDTEKLENVLSLLQSSVDGSLESTLDGMELSLTDEFMVKLFETPLVSGENLIRVFKWAYKKPEFKLTSSVIESLGQAISSGLKKNVSYSYWDLVKEIGEKENGLLNVGILNELIALFSKLGKGKAAFEVFDKFSDFGCVPDADTYYFTISALCRRSFFDWASSVCEKMLDAGSLPDSEKVGQIISWFSKGSKAKDAHLIYLLAKEKNKCPPLSSVKFLTGALCREDETVKLALEMLDDFTGETLKYAIKPYLAVISGLCRIKDIDGAKQLLLKMIAEGPPPGNAVFNSVINGYSKAGDLDKAKETMKLMKSRGLKPDVYTYTVIMSGYANGGQMEEACKLLSEAKRKHAKLSPMTYHTLIRGYCKLEEYDKALKLLNEMKDFGVQPTADEYNKLIQSLCLKALDWETAEKLLGEMKENGLHLNGITQGLIKAVKELEEEGLQTRELSAVA